MRRGLRLNRCGGRSNGGLTRSDRCKRISVEVDRSRRRRGGRRNSLAQRSVDIFYGCSGRSRGPHISRSGRTHHHIVRCRGAYKIGDTAGGGRSRRSTGWSLSFLGVGSRPTSPAREHRIHEGLSQRADGTAGRGSFTETLQNFLLGLVNTSGDQVLSDGLRGFGCGFDTTGKENTAQLPHDRLTHTRCQHIEHAGRGSQHRGAGSLLIRSTLGLGAHTGFTRPRCNAQTSTSSRTR